MRRVVADASALAEYLLGTTRAGAIATIVEAEDVELHAPSLCDVEVAAVVRRALLSKRLRDNRAAEAILDYLDLPLTRHGHTMLITRVIQLRTNFSAYDATYIALAERLSAEFLTADDALGRAARSHSSVSILP